MSSRVHDFREQLAIGENGEAVLDAYYGQDHDITRATPEEQRLGVDRWFKLPDGSRFGVEYKTDMQAHKTGNAFIELFVGYANGMQPKSGWAYYSMATWLVYYVPGSSLAYRCTMVTLRNALHRLEWRYKYPLRVSANKDYDAFGILVPLDMMRKISRFLDEVPHV